jgi:uncharacterized membrane protein
MLQFQQGGLDSGTAGVAGLAILATLFSLVTTIIWMSIAWRAMRAHERIAKVLEERARQE